MEGEHARIRMHPIRTSRPACGHRKTLSPWTTPGASWRSRGRWVPREGLVARHRAGRWSDRRQPRRTSLRWRTGSTPAELPTHDPQRAW